MVLAPPRDLEPRGDVKGGSKKTPAGGIALSKFLKWQKEHVTETKDVMDTTPRGSTPVPDPTVLTTQQLVREIAASREIIETRLDAMDVATNINKTATDKIPTLICEKVAALEKLQNEKFEGVEKQFAERDARTSQVSELNQKALDAALQAAKEAAGKTELSFTKQIADLTEQFNTKNTALEDRVNDLKGRLDRGEGTTGEQKESKMQQNYVVGLFVTIVLALIANAITLIYLFTHK